MPRKQDGPCALSVAFEPIVHNEIPFHPQLRVIPAAVTGNGANGAGLSKMTVYNDGKSSSFSKHSLNGKRWDMIFRGGRDGGQIKVVPVISLVAILSSIDHPIDLLMTDMQGYDFDAVKLVGKLLIEKGVKRVVSEVYFDDTSSYQEVQNDFCRDWLPYMKSVGYVYEGSSSALGNNDEEDVKKLFAKENAEQTCAKLLNKNGPNRQFKNGLKEFNALWRLPTVAPEQDEQNAYEYPKHYKNENYHQFTPEDYATCGW